jgi:diguanylate cyclase (GGDEF)-like protein
LEKWRNTALSGVLVPGSFFLLGAVLLAHSGWLALTLPSLVFLYYCALMGGMLLAWRFHSSRIFLALLVVFLTRQAIVIFGIAQPRPGSSASTLLSAIAVLSSFNLLWIAMMDERGFSAASLAPPALFLPVQSVIVSAVAYNIERGGAHHHAATLVALPLSVLLTCAAVELILAVRALLTRKPADSAFFWALGAFFLSLHFGGDFRIAQTYSLAALVILASAVVETSYLLAYHDELTGLPSRRAFSDALLRLQPPYSIAGVDIDHFKQFNDTYGHDVGDEVLRLVASQLARVTGGGQAYRCGGEEFIILFPGKARLDIAEHLEKLRIRIEQAEFRRRGADRRQVRRGPDRRKRTSRRTGKAAAIRNLSREPDQSTLAVTVSIGVASSSPQCEIPELVVRAADEALYRAKAKGRNRVEVAIPPSRRERSARAGIA